MKYVALLRGINVGGNRRVLMRQLKKLFEDIGCISVSTYINSGNVLFESGKPQKILHRDITRGIEKTFGFEVPTLVKTHAEMKKIAHSIPSNWENNKTQKTDVAYLFPGIDSKKTIQELPIVHDLIDIRYIKGALVWNLQRKDLSKSRLNKLVAHKLYSCMTLRNVNTARHLAGAQE